MKFWHVIGALIVVGLIMMFLVPPSIRCRFSFWNPNACSQIQQGVDMLQKVGVDVNPNMPAITQLDDIAKGFTNIRNPAN